MDFETAAQMSLEKNLDLYRRLAKGPTDEKDARIPVSSSPHPAHNILDILGDDVPCRVS